MAILVLTLIQGTELSSENFYYLLDSRTAVCLVGGGQWLEGAMFQ